MRHPGKLLRVRFDEVVTIDDVGFRLRGLEPDGRENKFWVTCEDGSEPWFNRDGVTAVKLTKKGAA